MFLHSAKELKQRQLRCGKINSLIKNLEFESTPVCNICSSHDLSVISDKDRYGNPIRTAICNECGLIFLLDRLTNKSYDVFYKEAIYRRLIYQYKYHGKAISSESRLNKQTQYAAGLLMSIDGLIDIKEGMTLLDIGGSEGGVSMAFNKKYAMNATVVDPSLGEIKVTEAAGLRSINSNFETWETDQKYDLILLCRTVEHLYDLKFVLNKIRSLLKPGGVFFMDFLDFNCECRRYGPPQNVSRIDHCFWLTSPTALKILPFLGYRIRARLYTLDQAHMGLLLESGDSKPIREYSQIEESIIYYQTLNDEWVMNNRPKTPFKTWEYKLKKKIRNYIRIYSN